MSFIPLVGEAVADGWVVIGPFAQHYFSPLFAILDGDNQFDELISFGDGWKTFLMERRGQALPIGSIPSVHRREQFVVDAGQEFADRGVVLSVAVQVLFMPTFSRLN